MNSGICCSDSGISGIRESGIWIRRGKLHYIPRLAGYTERDRSEEADESGYWLELIKDGGLMTAKRVEPLLTEANEFLAIFLSAHSTLRKRSAVSLCARRKSPSVRRPRT